ncbi:hypothetical protein GCM10007161_03650 [Ignatzschineria indica]|uniref:LemA family protein n=1 Tax=Ignatzschineria indica TaxID=472583 RepID=A0A2U2AMJ7_9GAMM|nr:LemA family protein [Ignatzschineria indica]PWD84367.1 hypothetical protein DC082_02155 [Ignatzschineria indica]GGZ75910.1 hypothetical protein GCM10007161_03650 [Ignatzschineria indica]
MKTTILTIVITILLSATILVLFLHHYRKLRAQRLLCETAFSDVLRLQSELIAHSRPIIVMTQKVLRDERKLYEEIMPLYDDKLRKQSQEEEIFNILLLRDRLNYLHKRAIRHPELKDLEELTKLWEKVEITNRNIDESASFYNDAAHDYREITHEFPYSMLAEILQYPRFNLIA